jgi:hypothetical protein
MKKKMYQKLTPQERIAARFIPSGYTEYKRSGDSVIYASPDHMHAIAYRGKAARSEWYYRFTSENGFLSAVTRFFESIDAHNQRTNDRKKERTEFTTSLKPGDILVMSWGWEQTNIDFYQVLDVVGKNTITMVEICSRLEETGFMQGKRTPIKNQFVAGAEFKKKRVQVCMGKEYVSMTSYASAHVWDGKPEFCSWYG